MESTGFPIWIGVLVAASLACNLTVTGTATPTFAAPSAAPTQIVATDTPGPTATIDVTPSPTIPMVSVSVSTNCRSGPSTDYEILWSLDPGEKAEVVGRNTPLNYWIVKIPNDGQCWLWGQYATVEGNISGLPEIPAPAPPPTATPSAPKPVTNLTFVGECSGVPPAQIFLGGDLSWEDKSDDEDGFRVYAGATLLATLAPDSTSYHVTVVGPYGVEAFNEGGASVRKTIPSSCP
jgi:hypothetical protein